MFKNILANYIGRFWGFLSAFLFTPIYIHFLGVEGFSIISFSLVIAGFMSVLDAGLSATLSREFAIKSNSILDKEKTLSTFEWFYFGVSLFIILIIFIFSNQIASNWLNLDKMNPLAVSNYLKIIGVGIAFQLLADFYIGGLMGLEKQVKGNIYQVGWGVVRNGLLVIPLYFYPSMELFFVWQTVTTIVYAYLLRNALIKELKVKIPIIRKPIIDKVILIRTWKFAIGMFLISLVASFNTQMDKLAISKLLPISTLGYYTIAISLSQAIVLLITPMSSAIIPRLTSLYSEKNNGEIISLFKKMTLLISILVFSFGCNIFFFAKELIWIWTDNNILADHSSQFIPVLIIGMIMYSFQILPYAIAIANGYTKLNNYLGLISLVVTLPGYWIMTNAYGAMGAAMTWSIVQTLLTIIYGYLIIRKFLPHIEQFKHIMDNYLKPFIIIIAITYLFSQFTSLTDNRIAQFLWIGLSTLTALLTSAFILIAKGEYNKVLIKFKINKVGESNN